MLPVMKKGSRVVGRNSMPPCTILVWPRLLGAMDQWTASVVDLSSGCADRGGAKKRTAMTKEKGPNVRFTSMASFLILSRD